MIDNKKKQPQVHPLMTTERLETSLQVDTAESSPGPRSRPKMAAISESASSPNARPDSIDGSRSRFPAWTEAAEAEEVWPISCP